MSGQDDDDYIPSQDVGVVDGSSTDRAPRGPALAMAMHRLDELYCAGGAVDSQTTNSQFVNELQEESVESPKYIPPPASPPRMPEPEKSVVSEDETCTGTDICECARNKRQSKKLERDIEVLKSGGQCSDWDDSDDDDKIPVYDFGGEVVWMKKNYPSQVMYSFTPSL
ncbi:hypothetical protein BC629DRAFT_1599966 [Irpex lacteus]|nr:hypothetical protein BC629DRAFT_1599966 [Irpex lacteus]